MRTSVTKTFRFSYAHILPNHKGKCKHLHGHNARVEVTISGSVDDRPEVATDGMVVDFGDIKRVWETEFGQWDHRFLAKGDEWPYTFYLESKDEEAGEEIEDDFVLIEVRSTAENLAGIVFDRLTGVFAGYLRVECVKFYETDDSFAEVVAQGG